MSSRPELNTHKFFADRFAAVLAQQGNSPRHVSSMGFGALAITDGSPSAAAVSAAVPSATASPVAVTTPLSSGQQEVRPAPVGLPHTSGRTATVVEIDDDDDEEMDGVRRGEETGVLVDDGEKGGADEDEEMGELDEDEEILSVDLGDPALFEDREMWVSELEKLSPVRDNEGSPEFRVRLQTSFGKKRVAYQEKMDALAEIKAEKRCRSPSAHNEVTSPSAKRVKETPRSSTGQAELFPSPSHEPGSARKASLREQDRLWQLFIDERERWEVASIDESCDRCRLYVQLPEEILPSLDHPTIALDPRIPEEEKQLATFRSVIIGLTTQLQANRRDTAKLVEYCVKLVSAMNTLSRTMATLVNSSDIGPLGRTELARVSRELTTDMSDFYRNLFDSPYLLNPTEYMLPPTLDWLKPSQPARLSSQDGAFLDILTLPADCLRTLCQLWKSPSLSVARDPALHSAHILAFNTAWKETRALRRAVGPKVTESSSGSGPAPGNEEQGGSSQHCMNYFLVRDLTTRPFVGLSG
ncbi:hypothetical protein TREMEDRAFT_61761 [Tremella mesenterica DSM 1558]|uniref:uncharacterized protein n=1 Tax=Tremella mesenterica (strain ATCC 24925 / CBS 8224 / DSM 1558 / NBRC 9311 / NRRL Y-6157 / RJB 2259-6 / UBC 559-6) TaxID=578456 RepID=UPI0003F4950C|nr:uncharacterized protein TREMEDRAFT_61761 [Tremella mesenterica DSM 1558]EIW69996.1 hypothetical protein TREMEDRAFT_61761 [Tremella mesenterica DSM 1558]